MADSIYDHPEKFGLELVAEIDYSCGSYEWDFRLIYRRVLDGVILTGRFSGCSCYWVNDSLTSFDDLEPINLNEILHEIQEEEKENFHFSSNEALDAANKVRSLR